MVIRYTPEEWEKLNPTKRIDRLDLAPEGVAEEYEQEFLQWSEQAKQEVHATPAWAEASELHKRHEKVKRAIAAYREAPNYPAFCEFIESQAFTTLDIAALAREVVFQREAVDRRHKEKRGKSGRAKYTGWQPAIIELYLKEGTEFDSKDDFCRNYAETEIQLEGGQPLQAPKAETMLKGLTDKTIDAYVDRRDVERRRGRIC